MDNADIKHYEALANAIIIQAVIDYKAVLKVLEKKPNDKAAQDQAKHIKRFFYSKWFRVLTSVDAKYLLQQVEREAESETTARRKPYCSKGRLNGNH